ncbi:unannotated protein [freshwater metagenome]|uniref:Unannotated protein n=1 Tax=freshwater metagenome TaxID=449393 RepID=A0A6J6X8R5_9ZZZZ
MASNGRGGRCADAVMAGAALQNGALEQTIGGLEGKQGTHAHGTSRFARNRDPPRVTAERSDVLRHPLQRRNLIENANVARVSKLGEVLGEMQEAECAKAIVDAHNDHALASERGAVVRGFNAAAAHKCAAMNPHKYRQSRGCRIRSPHAEVQTVVARRRQIVATKGRRHWWLRRNEPID